MVLLSDVPPGDSTVAAVHPTTRTAYVNPHADLDRIVEALTTQFTDVPVDMIRAEVTAQLRQRAAELDGLDVLDALAEVPHPNERTADLNSLVPALVGAGLALPPPGHPIHPGRGYRLDDTRPVGLRPLDDHGDPLHVTLTDMPPIDQPRRTLSSLAAVLIGGGIVIGLAALVGFVVEPPARTQPIPPAETFVSPGQSAGPAGRRNTADGTGRGGGRPVNSASPTASPTPSQTPGAKPSASSAPGVPVPPAGPPASPSTAPTPTPSPTGGGPILDPGPVVVDPPDTGPVDPGPIVVDPPPVGGGNEGGSEPPPDPPPSTTTP